MRFLCFFLINLLFLQKIYASEGIEPLYTGPLLTPSADNQAPGTFNIQPYLFVTDDKAVYDSSWHKRTAPKAHIITADSTFQFGLNNFLDITFDIFSIYQKKDGKDSYQMGDSYCEIGFQILSDEKNTYKPSIRFVVRETFPTGKYQKLDHQKFWTDAAGSGSYVTSLSLNLSKIVYWMKYHPIRFRLSGSYSFPTKVHVRDFHSHGGGYNTDGVISPSNIFRTFFSFEFSFTRKWVFATDFLYHYASSSSFTGENGLTVDGQEAKNSHPSAIQISLAPAIEYNVSPNFGMIAGVWFSVAGKNTADFISYVFSFTFGY